MRQGAIPASFKLPQKPDNSGYEVDGRFHEKVSLLFNPFPVKPEHNGAGRFRSIGDIIHGTWIQWVTPVGNGKIIEVDTIKCRHLLIAPGVVMKVIPGNL